MAGVQHGRRRSARDAGAREVALEADRFLAGLAVERDGVLRVRLAHEIQAHDASLRVLLDRALEGDVARKALDAATELVDEPTLGAAQEVALSDEQLGAALADRVAAAGKQERVAEDFEADGTVHDRSAAVDFVCITDLDDTDLFLH